MNEAPRYSPAGQRLIAAKHFDVRGVRRIDDIELLGFHASTGNITDFAIHHALLQMGVANFRELMGYYKEVQQAFNSTYKIDETTNDSILNEINRLLLNYLSSFRTMIDHYQTRYTRLDRDGSQYLESFKTLTGNVYDSSISYRFMYKMRNYVQHCGLPIQSASAKINKDEQGEVVAQLAVYFDRDTLLQRFDKWGKVKQDLEAQPAQIEISVRLVEFHQRVLDIYNGLVKTELTIVKDAHDYLAGLVSAVQNQLPGARPLIVDYSRISSSGGDLPALAIPIKELEIIEQIVNVVNRSDIKDQRA